MNSPSKFQVHVRSILGQSSKYSINGVEQHISSFDLNRALILNCFYQSVLAEGSNIRAFVSEIINKQSLVEEVQSRLPYINTTIQELEELVDDKFIEKGVISADKITYYFAQKHEFIV